MKIVHVIGMAESAINAFELDGEKWGINHAYIYGKCDRLFIMDDVENLANSPRGLSIDRLVECPVLITKFPLEIGTKNQKFMVSQEKGRLKKEGVHIVKTSQVFDQSHVAGLMGTLDLQCTLSYVIAQAIEEKVDMLVLHGVEIWEYEGRGAYGYQIRNVNDWCRIAGCLGIMVTVPFPIIPKITQKFHGE